MTTTNKRIIQQQVEREARRERERSTDQPPAGTFLPLSILLVGCGGLLPIATDTQKQPDSATHEQQAFSIFSGSNVNEEEDRTRAAVQVFDFGENKIMVTVSKKTEMVLQSYHSQAQVLVWNYLLADPFVPYTSVLGGLFACKLLYELSQLFFSFYSKSYSGLTKVQKMEWNNRTMSTIHAIFIASISLHFVFWSDLFSDQYADGLITFRSSTFSTFSLGVSVGYFIADLAMILWLYPSLGGIEFVIHHSLSAIAVAYSMASGEGQLYTYMVLVSEVTTPEINLRWYLDTAGMKRSTAYLINGVVIFFAWLVARILLFGYMFYHVYLHYNQVIQMHIFGYLLVFAVPSILAIMNLMWFGKILKGLKKTLAKRL